MAEPASAASPEARVALLYRGEETLRIDGIPCLPVEGFLRGLRPGRDVLAGRCATSTSPYVLRFRQNAESLAHGGFAQPAIHADEVMTTGPVRDGDQCGSELHCVSRA